MPIKTIFLDRDGVINKDVHYLYRIKDFIFNDGIFDACIHFEKLGYKIIIVTNQSGISRNFYSENDYQKLTKWMVSQFENNNIGILDIFHCPHGPQSSCSCRKPKPGMLFEAQIKHDIDMLNSWMIGDKERDIEAAISSGIKNTILLNETKNLSVLNSRAKYITNGLKDTKQLINC